ncbi:MAG: hypothetical protein JO257_10955 [Deltaproteobacteria bacterium]|nr:hypothetical protein [Deltaproteobacteria bacterium]
MRLMITMLLSFSALGACKGADPKAQCEDIYKRGDGEKSYATDKAKFMDVCTKTSDTTRKCLLEHGKERMSDKDCGPDGKAWDEIMNVMKTGQGTP